jgi:hypothetical protein
VKIQKFWGQSVAGRRHFLAARSSPEPNLSRSFPVAFYPMRTQRSYAWNGKNCEENEWFSPIKIPQLTSFSLTSLPKFVHLLSCHGSLQCPIHCCHREDDPSVERGTSHLGQVMSASHINQLEEGPIHYEGGH